MQVMDFKLQDKAVIRISSEKEIEKLFCCDEVIMTLLKDDQSYLLSTDTLHENVYILKNALKEALKNQLFLHSSITQDIGYLYNQKLQFKSDLIYEKYGDNDFWVGMKSLLWNHDLATWLYNDSNGDIVLHITPVYLGNWIGEGDDEEADERAYAEWIVHYKPFWTLTLSPATAHAWLDFAEGIFNRLRYIGC